MKRIPTHTNGRLKNMETESLSTPGRTAPHDLRILPLPGPGVTVHNRAYVASRAAIGKNPHGNLSARRRLGNRWASRGEPVPRAADSGDVGDRVVGQDGLELRGGIRIGRPWSPSRRTLRRPQTQVTEDFADDCRIVDERDHAHRTLTARAFERIDLVDLVNQARPGGADAAGLVQVGHA